MTAEETKKMWDLGIIRDYISKSEKFLDDSKRRQALANNVDSLSNYVGIFRYHLLATQSESSNLFKTKDTIDIELFKLVAGIGEEKFQYQYNLIACKANFIACVHTVRNIYDIFSQLINELILKEPLPCKKVTFFEVCKIMPPSELKENMKKIIEEYWFEYIAAFSNVVKHSSLIKSGPRFSVKGNTAGMYVASFDYEFKKDNIKHYDECWMKDALEGIVGIQNMIIDCGNILNGQLADSRRL